MATYYTSSSASGGGTGAIDNEWTLQEAADNATSSDIVLVKADGTYSETTTIDFDTQAAAQQTPVTFRGAASNGDDDGTVATVDGSGLTSADLFNLNIASLSISFENLRLTAATDNNVLVSSAVNVATIRFINCRIDNATAMGIECQEASDNLLICLENCEVDSNGTNGCGVNSLNGRGGYAFNHCTIHDNGSNGIQDGISEGGCVTNSLIYDNGADGIVLNSVDSSIYKITNTTIFANTGDGIDISSANIVMVYNTILRSNGGYGINHNSNGVGGVMLQRLCSHNNTSGHIDINGGTLPGANHILEDPNFVSETDGSEDLTPQNTNLAAVYSFQAGGDNYSYIGAIQPQASSGGGRRAHLQIHGG